MIQQLRPRIPVIVLPHGDCPGGRGYAFAWIDYSEEHDVIWGCAVDVVPEAEPWWIANRWIRFPPNTSLGRFKQVKP